MQTRRALILVGLSVICNKLDLVTYVGSWIKCPLYFGLSVIRSCLVLVGFHKKNPQEKWSLSGLIMLSQDVEFRFSKFSNEGIKSYQLPVPANLPMICRSSGTG